MDLEDLMAPAAYGDEDILGLLAGGSLSDALASQGAMPLDRRVMQGGEVRQHCATHSCSMQCANCVRLLSGQVGVWIAHAQFGG